MKKTIRIIIIIALLMAICVSGYKIFEITEQYRLESEVKESMQRYKPKSDKMVDAEDKSNQWVADLRNDINQDVVGWLSITDTRIDYPFVAAEDNNFYLRRDIYKNDADAGTLFMDCRCAKDFSDSYNIIYGHNQKNNSMFGDLALFADEEFFDAHSLGVVFLSDRTYTLEFFAYAIVNANDEIIYSTQTAQEELLQYLSQAAKYYREPLSSEKIVALSTCSYDYNGARIVLFGSAE